MSVKTNSKANKRFVMYIPGQLRDEIEKWVAQEGISLAEFGRAAFVLYLDVKKKEERNRQLAETCKMFGAKSTGVWASTEGEGWPS